MNITTNYDSAVSAETPVTHTMAHDLAVIAAAKFCKEKGLCHFSFNSSVLNNITIYNCEGSIERSKKEQDEIIPIVLIEKVTVENTDDNGQKTVVIKKVTISGIGIKKPNTDNMALSEAVRAMAHFCLYTGQSFVRFKYEGQLKQVVNLTHEENRSIQATNRRLQSGTGIPDVYLAAA